jgi:GNAT superfamily N-acetyltransferase
METQFNEDILNSGVIKSSPECSKKDRMMGVINYHLAKSTDETYLKSAIEAAYHEYPRLIALGDATLDLAVENVFERIAEEGFAHIATQDGRTVGAAWWTPDDNGSELGVAYFVEQEVRKQGVATGLLEAGLTEARNRGVVATTVKTHPDNLASIALARKLGFEPVVSLLRQDLR